MGRGGVGPIAELDHNLNFNLASYPANESFP